MHVARELWTGNLSRQSKSHFEDFLQYRPRDRFAIYVELTVSAALHSLGLIELF
jgi:hypothetical protein